MVLPRKHSFGFTFKKKLVFKLEATKRADTRDLFRYSVGKRQLHLALKLVEALTDFILISSAIFKLGLI
jgi:hypothetical protein